MVSRHQSVLDDISTKIGKYIDDGVLDGVSLGVVNREGLIWHSGYGFANREKGIRAGVNTKYRAGSLSKLLTATAILQLEEEGRIDIDQAVSAFIPRFGYKTRFSDSGVITARHLLTHLSGLPSNINKGQWTEERFDNVVQRLRMEFIAYPTDFILNYSNVAYSLLGVLIEENTNYLFEEYLQHHIIDPLGMTNTDFAPYGATGRYAAVGYKNGKPQTNLPIRDIPALGMNTSVEDLSKFIAAVLNKGRYRSQQIITRPTVESMFSVQNGHVALDYDDQIGLPWFLKSDPSSTLPLLVEHGGATINFTSQVTLAPDLGLGVIILSNSGQQSSLISNLASTLLTNLLEVSVKPDQRHLPVPPIDPEPQGEDKKLYVTKSGIVELDKGSGELCECQANRRINLVPLPDGWFGISHNNRNYSDRLIEQSVNGKEVIVLERDGKRHRLGSIYSPEPDQLNWNQHFGSYDIINPDEDFPVTDLEVFKENEITYICYRMPKLSKKLIVMPITPVSEQEAITEGLGRAKGETVYVRNIDGQDYLIYSGYVARKNPPASGR